jgi:RHS repeat-associated protein
MKHTMNMKAYEMSNHLGNVLVTVSDARIPANGTGGIVGGYAAIVKSATDYSAFGAPMPGRTFVGANKYRYTFNGKESDDETGTQDYGFRIYNPSLGRFLSVDPLTANYPMLTPYQFASDQPIWAIDLDGLERSIAIGLGEIIGTENWDAKAAYRAAMMSRISSVMSSVI